MSPAHIATIRVRYAETDQMGVVYYANYFVWFEIGRVELMRSLGFEYRDLEEQDQCFLPVVEANCRYRAPARYDDVLTLETRVLNQRTSMIRFGYRLLRETAGEGACAAGRRRDGARGGGSRDAEDRAAGALCGGAAHPGRWRAVIIASSSREE